MSAPAFDFSKLSRPRGSYARTLENYRQGLLSCGFMWELAKYDEVFAAFIRKNGVEHLARETNDGQ